MSSTRIHYAFVAGLFASAASFFGKFTSHVNETDFSAIITNHQILGNLILKSICLLLMLLCNVFVWTFFVKALHQKGGSLVATVLSMATNYSCSALIGSLMFGEQTSLMWWFGTSIVICGILFILAGTEEQETLKDSPVNERNAKKEN